MTHLFYNKPINFRMTCILLNFIDGFKNMF